MPQNITVYTTNTCTYCAMVKRYLDSKKLNYDVINIEENPEFQQKVFEMSGGLTVPVVHVVKQDGTDEVISGWKLTKLAPAIA